MKKNGFTLIELLVVIVIIGILAGIGISSFKNYKLKAQTAKVTAETKPLLDALIIARTLNESPLRYVTNHTSSGWSGCVSIDLRNIPDGSVCMNNWNNARNKISQISGIGLSAFKRDPWGSPYLLDENEGEAAGNYCRRDLLQSAGPNGVAYDDDDIEINIPFYDFKQCGI